MVMLLYHELVGGVWEGRDNQYFFPIRMEWVGKV